MEYKIDRVIYSDGRVVYEVYYLMYTAIHRLPAGRRCISRWFCLSLARTARNRLQGCQIISRKEVL